MKTEFAQLQDVPQSRRAGQSASALPLPMGLMGCAPDALEALRKLTVACVACGSVGGRIAVLLARMGFGGLLLVDPKSFKAGSLATHEIGPEDFGKSKALVVGRRCKAISPSTRVQVFIGPVEALELAALADVDLVVMAPDFLSVELELGQRCMWLGKPLVQASVHGATLTAQIRFFANAEAMGGCPACGYGQAEWDLVTRQARFSCEGAVSATAASSAEAPATNSLSALCSLAANLAVIQILRYLLKLGQPVANTMLQFNGFTHHTLISPLARHAQCKLEHVAFAQKRLDEPLARLSLARMTQIATGAPVAQAQFEVEGMEWIEFAACRCAQLTPVRRFVRRGGQATICPKCSTPLVPLDFYTHRAVSAAVLGSALEQPLCKLGARRVPSVVLRSGGAGMLIRPRLSPTASP